MFEAFIQYLITAGLPVETLYALLALPVIATAITVSRYIVGWKSLTVYTHILLVYAMMAMIQATGTHSAMHTLNGLAMALVIILPIVFLSLFIQHTTAMIRMHFTAKVSALMALLALWMIVLLYVAHEVGAVQFTAIHPLALIMSIVVLDPFVKSLIRKGSIKTFKLVSGTLSLSLLLSLVMSSPVTQKIILSYPSISLLAGIVSIVVGRWTGLRLSEIFRFKDINIDDDDSQHIQK